MSGLKLISWNVNGLRAICKKGLLEWIVAENPDILCLQETKVADEQIPPELLKLAGYHVFFNAAERKGYSGVALLTKEAPISVVKGLGLERFDNEGRVLVARYPDFTLFDIYFPNGGASIDRLQFKLDFYDALLEILVSLKKAGEPLVICGDVNTAHREIDLARPKENIRVSGFLPVERAWIDRMLEAGFVDTFRLFNQDGGQYTWWDQKSRARDRNIGWRIDYFLVSEALRDRVGTAFIQPEVLGSDHCPVGILLSRQPEKYTTLNQ